MLFTKRTLEVQGTGLCSAEAPSRDFKDRVCPSSGVKGLTVAHMPSNFLFCLTQPLKMRGSFKELRSEQP